LTTVALDPLRVMDAAHAFTSKLSTLFTGTPGRGWAYLLVSGRRIPQTAASSRLPPPTHAHEDGSYAGAGRSQLVGHGI
jgi:hypothetical protein